MAALDMKDSHVPYRNCTLTRLLQDVLGGQSRVMLIFTASPSEASASEMVLSFGYAKRMRNVTLGNKLPSKSHTQDKLVEKSAEISMERLRNKIISDVEDTLRA
eukprot:CAMPEP_0185789850 /NCGR_PEP_ID=MMETSP1174-20130828/153143_1 /TAXON_ID=35687 /ORGANISM="Dictyocha speculum, Strain CCMP1381" /LENGTH=103 /DNA_ID=CAMNT_0028484193 /DNA_START=9 /DNA_END=316 /DNA_ORIENTATION=-